MLFFNLLPLLAVPFWNNCSDDTMISILSNYSKSLNLTKNKKYTKTITFTRFVTPTATSYVETNTIEPTETSRDSFVSNSDKITKSKEPLQTPSFYQFSDYSDYTNSIATYYFRTSDKDVDGCAPVQNFNDGNSYGPCNNNQGVKYTTDSKYWVAIANAKQYCGKNIEVEYNGKSMILQVMDSCPACSTDNHVDMGLEALIELTGSKENACAIHKGLPNIRWRFVS